MSPADLTAKLEELHAAAFGWALSCCGWDRSAAEDVLQATYLKLLDGRASFDGRSTFRTFVFGVIARTAREARRRAALRRSSGPTKRPGWCAHWSGCRSASARSCTSCSMRT